MQTNVRLTAVTVAFLLYMAKERGLHLLYESAEILTQYG